jgi:hypothetical protein
MSTTQKTKESMPPDFVQFKGARKIDEKTGYGLKCSKFSDMINLIMEMYGKILEVKTFPL